MRPAGDILHRDPVTERQRDAVAAFAALLAEKRQRSGWEPTVVDVFDATHHVRGLGVRVHARLTTQGVVLS